MFKFIKVFIALVVLVVLALLALPFFIDVNDYKPEISKVVYDTTGRNVSIEDIQLSVFPWVGITLKKVQLENAKGFKNKHMATIKSIDIQVALMPLFNERIEVKRFVLDTPKIWLEQRADKSNNWQDLQPTSQQTTKNTAHPITPQEEKKKPTTAKKSTPGKDPSKQIALKADLLQLQHGQVIWSDESSGNITLSDIKLDIKDLQFTQPIALDLSAKLGGNPFSLHASIGPIGDINKLDITKLPIRLQFQTQDFNLAPFALWLPNLEAPQVEQFGDLKLAKVSLHLSIEQHADSMILSDGSLQVKSKDTLDTTWKISSKGLKSLTIQTFNLSANDTHLLKVSGRIKSLSKSPHYELRIETAKLQRTWLNHFIPALKAPYQNHPKPWESIKLGALIAGDQEVVDIRDLQLELNDEHIQASGNIALGAAPDIQLRISADELHLDPWIPQSAEAKHPNTTGVAPQNTSAKAQREKQAEPDLTFLKPWYLSLQLNAKRISVMQLQLDNLRLTLSSEKGVVRLNPLKFEISGGQISENFTLYANKYPATWKESIKVSGVSVQSVLKAVADFDQLSGTVQLTTNLSGTGLLPTAITKSLSGNGHFVFEDGQFKGVDIAKEIRKFRKQDSTSQNTTDFAQMQGSFRINKGILTNNDLYIASPLFRLTGKGKLYLDPLKLDFHVRPRLIESLAGQGGNKGERGIEIPLHISGPFDNINVSVEMDKDALLNSAAAINKAAGKPIGGVAGKVLDQGFVKTRDEEVAKAKAEVKRKADARIAAEKARLEAEAKKKVEQQLKNAFKGLF